VLTAKQIEQLDTLGYAILEDAIPGPMLAALRSRIDELFAQEGEAAGSEFRHEPGSQRLANCVDKGGIFVDAILFPPVVEAAERVLGRRMKLSSLNVRSANPHNGSAQPLHCDTGAVRDKAGYSVFNSVWMIDDFTVENGAIRAVPGTHLLGKLPQEVIADLKGGHPDEVVITGRTGTIVVMNAHTWHGGTENRTDRPRCAMHGFYTRFDKPQQQYQKKLLRPETQAGLSAEARRMLALDDPLNDELCSRETQMSGFLK
jgi:ectoine hydroxylase-related dioxygenase (phytanoyl-CoA dioxygenase family)